jgi:uncharacterized protein (TIGR02646 family)
MIQIKPPNIDRVLLARLNALTRAEKYRKWPQNSGDPGRFKKAITKQLIKRQKRRCAFCGTRLFGEEDPRDHIAPKAKHKEFTFEPRNLVLTCYPCNSICKKSQDTIVRKKKQYGRCTFSIVHPYLDVPSDHIDYVPGCPGEILIQKVGGSQKGENTIMMFKLDSGNRTKERALNAQAGEDIDYLGNNWQAGYIALLRAGLRMKTF